MNLAQALIMSNSNKKKAIALTGIAIFSAAGFIFSVLVLNLREIAAKTAEKKEIAEEYRHRIAVAREFMQFIQEEKEKFSAAAGLFADSAMPLGLIGSLEAAAKTAGVKIEILPLAAQNKEADWPFMMIEAKVGGDSLNVWRFIEMMENNSYLTEIENVSVVLQKDLPGQKTKNFVQAKILMKIYAKNKFN